MLRPGLQPEGEVVVHGLHAQAGQQQEVRAVRRQTHGDALRRPAAVSDEGRVVTGLKGDEVMLVLRHE